MTNNNKTVNTYNDLLQYINRTNENKDGVYIGYSKIYDKQDSHEFWKDFETRLWKAKNVGIRLEG